MQEILNIIHKTIYQFFDACEDDAPMSDKDKLLLEVNKTICNNLKAFNVPDTNVGDLISRQAAIDAFEKFINELGIKDEPYNYGEMALSVQNVPSVEPEKCCDCVSRRSIIGKCEDTAKATSESGEINTGFIMALDFIADYAKHLPSVEPEQKDRECASCKHSNNGECAYTEECHECMWESQYERKVEPERKPGHWEWDQRTGEYVCSECGCNPIYERTTPDVSEIDKYRFCRWCGAPMEVNG